MARHAIKVLFTFCLLDRQHMPLPTCRRIVRACGSIATSMRCFFRLPPAELADLLIGELERAGAVREREGILMPG